MRYILPLLFCLSLNAATPEVSILLPNTDFLFFNGSPVQLIAFGDDDLTYTWRVSTGETLTGKTASFTASGKNPIRITLIATNGDGESSIPRDRILYPADFQFPGLVPKVTELVPSAREFNPGDTLRIQAEIQDPDQDGPYVFHWFWLERGLERRSNDEVLEIRLDGAPGDFFGFSLIVRDRAGRYSLPANLGVSLTDGNLSPFGRITEPRETSVFLERGDVLNPRATVGDPEGDRVTIDWLLSDGTLYETDSPRIVFTEPGEYQLFLRLRDSAGNGPNVVDLVSIVVYERGDAPPPTALIAFPQQDTRIFEGESLPLFSFPDDGNAFWVITNQLTGETRTLTSENPGRVIFPESGLYRIRLRRQLLGALSEKNSGNFRWIAVWKRDGNRPPFIRLSPDQASVVAVANGAPLTLSVQAEDPEGGELRYYWNRDSLLIPGDGPTQMVTPNLPDEAFTNGVAVIGVEVRAVDEGGKATPSKFGFVVYVYSDKRPPRPIIDGLPNRGTRFLPLGQRFNLASNVSNPDQVPVTYAWSAKYTDEAIPFFSSSQANPGSLLPPRAGLITLILWINQIEGVSGIPALVYLHVYDPDLAPLVRITEPSQSIVHGEPGAAMRFDGFVRDPNYQPPISGIEGTNTLVGNIRIWSLTKPDNTVEEFTLNTPLRLTLQTPGAYTLSLRAVNRLNLTGEAPEKITIEITEPRGEDGTEPNNSQDQAGSLDPGNYGALSVSEDDPVDWYRFTLERAGALFGLDIDLSENQQSISLEIFQGDRRVNATRLTPGIVNRLRFPGGKAGVYYLKLSLDPSSRPAKMGLGYSLGVSVQVPWLTFPYTRHDQVHETSLSVVNPLGGTACIALIAHAEDGAILAEAARDLAPKARIRNTVDELFPSVESERIAWINVLSDRQIVGMATTTTRDGVTAVAEWASVTGLDTLIVPHIAQQTNQWYTQASLANPTGDTVDAYFSAAAGDYSVTGLTAAKQATTIDFQNFFGGALPSGSEWGSFVDANAKDSLTGVELFGTRLGSPRLAGLRLSNRKYANPNFTYVNRDIIFPHIAEDQNTFWTGIAFVNTSENTESMRLVAYDNGGVEIAAASMDLAPFEKRVDLAQNFFPELDDNARVSWIRLETLGEISGYALFGDNTGDDRRLAGLVAVEGGSKEAYFLDIPANDHWNGIAAVNLSETATATLTYEAYADDGALLTTVTDRTIGPRKKEVLLVETIFGGELPEGLGWIKLISSEPLAAFQLFGDESGEYMAGATAQ